MCELRTVAIWYTALDHDISFKEITTVFRSILLTRLSYEALIFQLYRSIFQTTRSFFDQVRQSHDVMYEAD